MTTTQSLIDDAPTKFQKRLIDVDWDSKFNLGDAGECFQTLTLSKLMTWYKVIEHQALATTWKFCKKTIHNLKFLKYNNEYEIIQSYLHLYMFRHNIETLKS